MTPFDKSGFLRGNEWRKYVLDTSNDSIWKIAAPSTAAADHGRAGSPLVMNQFKDDLINGQLSKISTDLHCKVRM